MKWQAELSPNKYILGILSLIFLSGALSLSLPFFRKAKHENRTVRVAAIQCCSDMGATEENLECIVKLARKASEQGAKIVVTPECALQGYCYPPTWTTWTSGEKVADDEMDISKYAVSIDSEIMMKLARLADDCNIYLCIGFIEKSDGKYYNSQALFDPAGKIVGHHRKWAHWPPGDSGWCSEGNLPIQVVETEYGKLGMMICRDYQLLMKALDDAGADIVLYSVGWYGPNEENWFTNVFPHRAVIPYRHHVISANWCGRYHDDDWPGRGFSCIIEDTGKVLAISKDPLKECVILADLNIH